MEKLKNNWIGFKSPQHYTINKILYPYNIKDKLSINKQIGIWKEVLGYVKATTRLKNLRFVNMNDV